MANAPSLAKDLGVEPIDACIAAPRVDGQTRLHTRLPEELLRGPTPFDRHLRQQQAAAVSFFDDQTVLPNGEGIGLMRIDRLERAENRDLQRDLRQFVARHRRKSGILRRRLRRAAGHFVG